ncbi:MAG TPA: hypothetical protein G4O04_09055 [Anaerolineae bacterium]|nr:hypothetical protein [Anaerolineae bacterium]HID84381.1 hypothetical protein [Anaerolineales bacterium]HIQ08762.1 hypothetical protein [Anaerolineaceae bacterium]
MAAINTVPRLLNPGDHVIAGNDVYGGTFRLFDKVLRRYGLTFTFVETTDPGQVAAALRAETRMIWLETPSNPLLRVTDIAALAQMAHAHPNRPFLMVDNTFATPYLSGPLTWGQTWSFTPPPSIWAATPMWWAARWSPTRPRLTNAWPSCRTPSARCRARWTASWCCGASRPCPCGWTATPPTRPPWPTSWPGIPKWVRGFTPTILRTPGRHRSVANAQRRGGWCSSWHKAARQPPCAWLRGRACSPWTNP